MGKRIMAMLAGIAIAMGVAIGFAAPASAGNGTNDFYLTGAVNVPYSWTSVIGARMWATNWDYGANQKYHIGCSTSGIAYRIQQISIDGLNMGTSCDQIRTISGHGSHYLKLVISTWPEGNILYGGFRL